VNGLIRFSKVLWFSCSILLCACNTHMHDDRSGDGEHKIDDVLNKLSLGMTTDEVLAQMIPVIAGHPHYKELDNGNYEYYFLINDDSQVRMEMRLSQEIKNVSPSFPNGILIKIGEVEPKKRWERIYEDSLEIK